MHCYTSQVGKSTLFNRLCGTRAAIVSDVPGTTRDRKVMKGFLSGLPLTVIDTGGYDDRGSISSDIKNQVEQALNSVDVVLFVLDARSGVTAVDVEFSKWLRKNVGKINASSKSGKQVDTVVLANKTEGGVLSEKVLGSIEDSLKFGFGTPFLISASHGDGLADLADYLIHRAKTTGFMHIDEDLGQKHNDAIKIEERTIQLAIMGRPNVGKSTLLNR